MTTYTAIADTDIDQDSPVTQPLMQAMRDNPIAMAEGASGAPKIATKNLFGAQGSGSVDFDVTDFNGGRFFIEIENGGASVRNMSLGVSDGGAFDTLTLRTLVASETTYASGYFNKINGEVYLTGVGTPLVGAFTTIGTGVTTLRFTGTSDLTYSVHLMPDGGETTT